MMSDSKVAKLLLSTLIGEQIADLSFTSTEYQFKPDADKGKIDKTLEQLVVCHFDFNAKIKTKAGEYKTVHIELQKAKRATDIMRFRHYLGTMYQDTENTFDEKGIKARQIYSIYFLNYEIGLSDAPVIKVGYTVSDLATGEPIDGKSEFVDSLHHLSWIVQVRQLKQRRRNEIEELLSIFDQSYASGNKHFIEIDETRYPKKFRPLTRKLIEAFASKKVRIEMQLEDDYLKELLLKDETIAEQAQAIVEKDNTIVEKDNIIVEKDNIIAAKDEALAAAQANIRKMIINLSASGMNNAQIAKCTNCSEVEIEQIITDNNS
jgi:hypothetical protein